MMRAGPGELFAESALAAEHYGRDAICVRPARVALLPVSAITRAMANPDFASTVASVAKKGGMQVQGIGRCCGGRVTGIHPVTDECDRPLPTGDTTARSCAHGSDNNGAIPVIPPRGCHKEPPVFDRKKYRLRNVVERTFCRLKDFRRISTTFA